MKIDEMIKYEGYVNVQLTNEQFDKVEKEEKTFEDFSNEDRVDVKKLKDGTLLKTCKIKLCIFDETGKALYSKPINVSGTKVEKVINFANMKMPIKVITQKDEGEFKGKKWERLKLVSIVNELSSIVEGTFE